MTAQAVQHSTHSAVEAIFTAPGNTGPAHSTHPYPAMHAPTSLAVQPPLILFSTKIAIAAVAFPLQRCPF